MKTTVYVTVGIPMEVNDKYAPLKADWRHNYPSCENYDELMADLFNDLDATILPAIDKAGWEYNQYMCVQCDGSDDYLMHV